MDASHPTQRSRLRGESLRFLLGGGFNTLLTYLFYWILLSWLAYGAAYTLSYAAGIFTGFAINTWFVFRCTWSWRKLAAFPLVHLTNYALGLAVIFICVRFFLLDPRIAPVVATAVVLPFNFLLTRSLLRSTR